ETEIHIGQSSLLVEFSLLRRDDGSIDFAQLLFGLAISRHDAGQERPRAPDLRDPAEALRHGLAFPGDEVAGSELRRDQSIPRIFEVRKTHLVVSLQVIPDQEPIPQMIPRISAWYFRIRSYTHPAIGPLVTNLHGGERLRFGKYRIASILVTARPV